MGSGLFSFGLITAFIFGLLIGNMVGSSSCWNDGRMFRLCLEYKKDFDLCKREVYGK